jgi:hypothetical protein
MAPAPTTTTRGPRPPRDARVFAALEGEAFPDPESACATEAAGSAARRARREILGIPVKSLAKAFS